MNIVEKYKFGQMAEQLTHHTVNVAGQPFVGASPTLPTKFISRCSSVVEHFLGGSQDPCPLFKKFDNESLITVNIQ